MSNTTMFPVPPNFNIQELVGKITQMYQAKGFVVTAMPMGEGASIDFRKDDDGIKKYVGLALGLKANIMIQGETVIVNYTDAEWTGKIVAFVIGWFVCIIPWITAIIGTIQQSGLPKSIGNDIQMIAGGCGMAQPFGVPQQQYPPAQQTYTQPDQSVPQPQSVCKQCGAVLAENAQFCTKCGININ